MKRVGRCQVLNLTGYNIATISVFVYVCVFCWWINNIAACVNVQGVCTTLFVSTWVYVACAISWCISELHSSYDWSTSSVGVFSMCIFFLFPSIESDGGSYNVLRGWTCVQIWYRGAATQFFTSFMKLLRCSMLCGVWCIFYNCVIVLLLVISG